MIQHTQTIRQQQPTNCLSVFDHFVGLALKELTKVKKHFLNNELMCLVHYISRVKYFPENNFQILSLSIQKNDQNILQFCSQ